MRRLSLLGAASSLALALAVTALAATSPAHAAYNIIRWDNSGVCQLWDDQMKLPPPAGNKTLTKKPIAVFQDALAAKDKLVAAKTCSM
jgi:hypothetical protein